MCSRVWRNEDFAPLEEMLCNWLEPKTKKYARATIEGGNLLQPHREMLIDIKGHNCLEIALELEPYSQAGENTGSEQRQALTDAVIGQLKRKLEQYRYRAANDARSIDDIREKAQANMSQSRDQWDFAHDCIDYYREQEMKKINDKLLANINAAGEAYMRRIG